MSRAKSPARIAAVVAALAVTTAAARAQSPLVQDPQQGATPRPLAPVTPTPVPPPPPTPPQPLAQPSRSIRPPVLGPPTPRGQPAIVTQRFTLPPTGGLPSPTNAPLAIDPASDPILRLARAQSSAAEFRAAIAAAVAANPGLDESLAQRAEAVAARNEAVARKWPVLDLSVSSFRVIDRQFSNDPLNLLERSRPRKRTDATARGQFPLIDFGASDFRVIAAKERIEAAVAGTEDTGAQLALRAIAAWYNVYGYRALVGLGEAFAASQRELRGQVEQRVKQGVAAPADLAQVDSYIASADSQLADFRRALASAEAQFIATTGRPAPASLGRAPEPDLSAVRGERIEADAESLALVRAARSQASASRAEAKAAGAELFPQLTLGADAGRYGVIETENDYDVRANVTLSWRIGGGGKQRMDQARARADGAEARARRIRIEAIRDAEIALADVDALQQAQTALENNYLAARRSRDTLAERFRVSRGTLFDVVAAESNFFSVAARYIQTVTELDTARYVLLARTGRLLPALAIEPEGWNRK